MKKTKHHGLPRGLARTTSHLLTSLWTLLYFMRDFLFFTCRSCFGHAVRHAVRHAAGHAVLHAVVNSGFVNLFHMSFLLNVCLENCSATRVTSRKRSRCCSFDMLAIQRDNVHSPRCELECSVFARVLPPVPRNTGRASASCGHCGTSTSPLSSLMPRLNP